MADTYLKSQGVKQWKSHQEGTVLVICYITETAHYISYHGCNNTQLHLHQNINLH